MGLVIMDEIHLLGLDRGPVLEVIVSRMRFIAQQLALEQAQQAQAALATDSDGSSETDGNATPAPQATPSAPADGDVAAAGIRMLGLSTALVSRRRWWAGVWRCLCLPESLHGFWMTSGCGDFSLFFSFIEPKVTMIGW